MDKSGKVWGFTSTIFSKNNVGLHRIFGYMGGKSSIHRHTAKWSMFFVERGILKISIEKNDYPLTDETTLMAGQSIIVQPKEFHSFEIMVADTVFYEIYWTELDSDDIERKNSGSI
jgi:mannose-6-phosphate isomerase-like protein (cupin superfamily)